MTAHRTAAPFAAIPVVVALVSCGTGTQSAADQTPTSTSADHDDVRLSCSGRPPGWPADAMEGGTTSRFDRDELADALKTLTQEAGIDAPHALRGAASIDAAPWIVLTESDESVTVATGAWDRRGAGANGHVVELERIGSGWRATQWGDCTSLAPVLEPGLQWVTIHARSDVDTASTEVAVSVSETDCTSGRDPRPFLGEPRIVEDSEAVTIYWTSETPTGESSCVGNPPAPQTVHLQDPVGDRALLDGSSWPARPIANGR